MSGSGTGTPDRSFHDRLGRVAERREPEEAARPQVNVLPDWRENVRTPMGFAIAVFTGIVAVVIVRLVRYHATGGDLVGGSPDLTMGIDLLAAGMVSLLVFSRFNYKGFPFVLAQMAGVVLMLTTMHNAVHSAPSLFNVAFSPAWTKNVVASTDPGSVLLRGQSIAISTPEEVMAEAEVVEDAPKRRATGLFSKSGTDDAEDTAEDAPVKPPVLRLN